LSYYRIRIELRFLTREIDKCFIIDTQKARGRRKYLKEREIGKKNGGKRKGKEKEKRNTRIKVKVERGAMKENKKVFNNLRLLFHFLSENC
jgi:hypothetical protein